MNSNLFAPLFRPLFEPIMTYDLSSARRYYHDPVSILGASLLGWWTADRSDLITLAGAAMTSWKDVVAGRDMVQAVSGARPTWSETSFNGAPGATFDGVDDEMTLPSQPFPTAGGFEIWAILSQDALPADATTRIFFGWGGDGSVNQLRAQRIVVSGVNRAQFAAGNGVGGMGTFEPAADLSGRRLVRSRATLTDIFVSVDGGVESPVTAGTLVGTTRVRVGANANNAPAGFWSGKIRDILVTSTLTAPQVTALNAWALPRRM